MGDPSGVGPEIISLALEDKVFSRNCVVVGDITRLRVGARKAGSSTHYELTDSPRRAGKDGRIPVINVDLADKSIPFGQLNAHGGECAWQCIIKAVDLAMEGAVDAIVTAPINKESLQLAGHMYPGHTEILADRTRTSETVMMLAAGAMRVLHVTTHIPISKVPGALSTERILRVLQLGDEALKRMGIKNPRFAVAGLNPHAGESGIFGDEEERIIAPAIDLGLKEGINVTGPLPPDVVFLKMYRGKYDATVAMYHDQGHIPLKLIAFESGVNVSLGLPIIRTSVDHGTAFDIAGKGLADPGSLIEALRLAASMAGSVRK
ncbi:MAG: 4-hydroxythreonine-4-phosphate dehydrogenase PdxA [bacterium]|nr:MAG: 4-hydroxythreonine-4-phosphate dehydrogenase PdxA [bacterium]